MNVEIFFLFFRGKLNELTRDSEAFFEFKSSFQILHEVIEMSCKVNSISTRGM